MKNTLINMILVLGGISLVASAGVGYVYKITEELIALAVEANKKAALGEVLPAFDETSAADMELDGIPVTVHTATQDGSVVGYAVETATTKGFSGLIKLMVGFEPDGKIRSVKVLEHSETPGLGDKMAGEGNPLLASFKGRNPSEMKLAVKKDGGEVDALTAATITSRAYVDAVARAFNAKNMGSDGISGEVGKVDANTGATSQPAETSATPSQATESSTTQQNTENEPGKEAVNE